MYIGYVLKYTYLAYELSKALANYSNLSYLMKNFGYYLVE